MKQVMVRKSVIYKLCLAALMITLLCCLLATAAIADEAHPISSPTVAWNNASQTVFYSGTQAEIMPPTVTLPDGGVYNQSIRYAHRPSQSNEPYRSGLPVNVGSYEVLAYTEALASYPAVQTASPLHLTVQKAPLYVSAKPHVIEYGSYPEHNGVLYSGFRNGEGQEVLEGTLGFLYSYERFDSAGEYTVLPCGLYAQNYDVICVGAKLTVVPKRLALVWDDTPLIYNGHEQRPLCSLVGIVNHDVCNLRVSKGETNAGKGYTVSVLGIDNPNYTLPSNTTRTYSIHPKDIANAEIRLGGVLTYNGAPQTQTVSQVILDGKPITYTVINNTATDAGNYFLRVVGSGNYGGHAICTWSIAKKDIAGLQIELGKAPVYNGSIQSASVTLGKIDGLTPTCQISGNTAVNAGSYVLTLSGTQNYCGSVTKSWQIEKAKPTLTPPTAKALTYTGEAQQLLHAGSVQGGRLLYSLSANGPFTNTVPVATNAGSYSVFFRVTGDSNHLDTPISSLTVTVEKAIPKYTLPTEWSATYGDTLASLSLPQGFSWQKPADSPVGNAGTQVLLVTYLPDDTQNFCAVTDIELTLTVLPKAIMVSDIDGIFEQYLLRDGAITPPVTAVRYEGKTIPTEEYSVKYGRNTTVGNAYAFIMDEPGGNYDIYGFKRFEITNTGVIYELTQGKDGAWRKGTRADYQLASTADPERFVAVLINGTALDPQSYTVSDTGVISLRASYLNTLSKGNYTLSVAYTDGDATGSLTLQNDDTLAALILITIALGGSALVISVFALAHKKKVEAKASARPALQAPHGLLGAMTAGAAAGGMVAFSFLKNEKKKK